MKKLNLSFNKFDSFEEIRKFLADSKNFQRDQKYFEGKSRSIHNAVSRFSVPSFESGATRILSKVFPSFKSYNFLQGTLKPKDILDKDVEELEVFAREKKLNISDYNAFNYTLEHIFKSITNTNNYIEIADAIKTLPTNTSSGYPLFLKKGNKLAIKNCVENIKSLIKFQTWHEKFKFMREFPCTIFHRFTPKVKIVNNTFDPNFKIRQIQGVPFFIVAIEKFILHNFVESIKYSFKDIYTIGYTKVQISNKIKELRNTARISNKVIICGDINGCDKSISRIHSYIYFQLASNFVPKYLLSTLEAILCYYVRTPIIYKNGLIYTDGSTITGSWITSSFTTMSVMVAIYYSYYKMYGRFPQSNEFSIQGDDFILILNDSDDKLKFKEYMLEHNLHLRLDRSNVVKWFENIDFLGYSWDFNNTPDQTDEWIISHIMYPEKYIKFEGPLRIIYRILSIIINLRRFRLLFNLIRVADRKLNDLLNQNNDLEFNLISPSNQVLDVKIPIRKFYSVGWRML